MGDTIVEDPERLRSLLFHEGPDVNTRLDFLMRTCFRHRGGMVEDLDAAGRAQRVAESRLVTIYRLKHQPTSRIPQKLLPTGMPLYNVQKDGTFSGPR